MASNPIAVAANWVTNNSGTGSTTFQYSSGANFIQLVTGATNGSIAEVFWPVSLFAGVATGSFFSCAASLSTGANARSVVGMFIGAPSTDTAFMGCGFKVTNNGNVFAFNSDGVTATTTDLGLSAGTPRNYLALYQGSSIKFYVDGILKATHTTNLPTAIYRFSAYIKNSFAADYGMTLYCPVMAGGTV